MARLFGELWNIEFIDFEKRKFGIRNANKAFKFIDASKVEYIPKEAQATIIKLN
jgi:hypothetical protein